MQPLGPREKGCEALRASEVHASSSHRSGMKRSGFRKLRAEWVAAHEETATEV